MAKWILLNTTSYEPGTPAGLKVKLLPGHAVDDSVTPTAGITGAGGILWPAADTTVAAAAKLALKMSASQGANEAEMAAVMFAAALASVRTGSGGIGSMVQKLTIDVPLATLKLKTSTTPFNVGAVLPAGFVIVAADVNVIQATVGSGPLTAATLTVQNTSETAGALLASTDIFTAAGIIANAGSNPLFSGRAGQQLQATVTTTGGTMANFSAGHVAIDLYNVTAP